MRPGGLAGHSAALIGYNERGTLPARSPEGDLGPGTCGDRGFGALPGHILTKSEQRE